MISQSDKSNKTERFTVYSCRRGLRRLNKSQNDQTHHKGSRNGQKSCFYAFQCRFDREAAFQTISFQNIIRFRPDLSIVPSRFFIFDDFTCKSTSDMRPSKEQSKHDDQDNKQRSTASCNEAMDRFLCWIECNGCYRETDETKPRP